ncbi:glycosyltransferase [Edaphobacter dinghuensis]|uniref:WbnK-like family glycosyltransferase n=1 Tax=Edaphobacter dinghuensis TaxID=1560005 RepID=A0A917H776_9BACT|nr:glycosyltransferase [Edaphobacter dinghuensis]GGG69850.1 WbnK-like family glycosyltransferase [Edaphobacter dinghuensis]
MITSLQRTPKLHRSQDADLPHVLFVIDQFSKNLGGGERIALKLAARLPQYGYRASILTFSADPADPVFESAPCPVYLLPLQRTYDRAALAGAIELRQFLKQQKIQIVQTFFESSDIWAGSVTKLFSNAKLIWSRRDMGILRTRKHEIAYRLLADLPDAVFAVSDLVRQHCIEEDHIDPDRVETIYNGLDLDNWGASSQSTPQRDKILVTTIGNIRHVKGHDVFVKAAAVIAPHFPNVYFSIAGGVLEPSYFEELQALVRDLNLEERFHFTGAITNLEQHLSAADIFVLPSRSEGFSNAIVEAMATSLPVVATNVGGNAEAVQNDVSGLIVPAEDSDALAAAIIRLLADPAMAKAMGIAGKQRVAERFTTEAMLLQTTATYRKLLTE